MSVLKRKDAGVWEVVGGGEAPPIKLGYTANTSLSQTTTGTQVDIIGLSVTVNVAAGRTIKITGHVGSFANTATACQIAVYVQEGTTILGRAGQSLLPSTQEGHLIDGSVVVVSPSAGSHTYKLTVSRASGSGTVALEGTATHPAFILVEDITGGSGAPSGSTVWTDYTPTWTNLTLGNGTQVARYTQSGKTVSFRVDLIFGTTTSISGSVQVGLPVAASASGRQSVTAIYNDSGTKVWLGGGNINTGSVSTANLYHSLVAGGGTVNATEPFTWTTSDRITVSGTYESA